MAEMAEHVVQLRAFTESNSLATELKDKDAVSKAVVGGYSGLHAVMAIDGEVQVLLAPVESSNISHVGWLPEIEGELPSEMFVIFKNSGIYGYKKVELAVFLTFMNSSSKGRFLNSKIKGPYEFERYL